MANGHRPHLPAFLTQSKGALHATFVDLEWQQRNRLLQGTQRPASPSAPPSQWSRLSGEAIAARNRYLNVEPYAQNRIKLAVGEGASDYINASPIVLGKRRYIATQGPKHSSVNHFYRMVDDDNVVKSPVVVVMLTQTHEAGREKCFQYYPLSAEESPLLIEDDEELRDGWQGMVTLDEVERHEDTRSEVRRMRLRTRQVRQDAEGKEVEAETREKEIHHLLFSGWPDFLVPEGEDREALVSLIQLSARLNQQQAQSQQVSRDSAIPKT
jgi:protein-tyrosine phosphatase